MSTIDRCTCYQELIKHVGDGFSKFQITEKDDACHVHGDIDKILTSGEYFDRKGELWHQCECPADGCGNWHMHHPSRGITTAQMRLLIERDHHRDVCPRLADCEEHPVPVVSRLMHSFEAWGVGEMGPGVYLGEYPTLPEAMDAARALVVGP